MVPIPVELIESLKKGEPLLFLKSYKELKRQVLKVSDVNLFKEKLDERLPGRMSRNTTYGKG